MEFTAILAQIRHERSFADNENFYVFSLLKRMAVGVYLSYAWSSFFKINFY